MKEFENNLYNQGYKNIAGLDEAGRGSWAGPLVVAICVFDKNYQNSEIIDSKKLTPLKREILFEQIKNDAIVWDFVIYDADFVDQNNPKKTSIIGMEYLIEKYKTKIDFSLIDAEKINPNFPHISIIKGDQKSQTIAAASIIAKVIRDNIMLDISSKYPDYHFKKNKGYGTKEHLEILKKLGPIDNVHRFSYKPVKNLLSNDKKINL